MTPEKRSGSFITVSSPHGPRPRSPGLADAARRLPPPARRCPSSYRAPRAKSRSGPAERRAPRLGRQHPLERLTAVGHLARRSRRAGQARKDVAGDQLDLRGLVTVGEEDEPIHARIDVGAKLRNALVCSPADRVLDLLFAPGGHI